VAGGSECTQAFKDIYESNQAKFTNVQVRNDNVRAREESLQARASELIRRFNSPDGTAGSKKD
jgi:hypothetical protein